MESDREYLRRLARLLSADDSSSSERNEQPARLADALASLPVDQREAVERYYLHGWPLADVAVQLERSPKAVGSLLHRGIVKLHERLASGG